jgi:hypothetical protein
MNFCDNCDNMLYMKIDEINPAIENGEDSEEQPPSEDPIVKNKILYYCRCCNNEYPNLHKDNSCLFSINYNTENIKKNSFINKYMYDDITLPNAEGIKCQNSNCPAKAKPNIKYIQYDKDNMKYIYICMDCYENGIADHIW